MDWNNVNFSRTEQWLIGGLLVALVAALFVNLGVQPFYVEEPRRALIALEMYFNNNLWVPTEMGEYYYKKPPLWNWIILGSFKLFGNYSEFAARFFGAVSFLAIGGLIYYSGKRFVGVRFGVLSALFFLISGDLLFHFSQLAEIDLFYSLITYGGFLTIYHFHHSRQYLLLFLSTYLLAALGTLAKGVPSLIFVGLSLLVFFVYRKEFKKLFAWQHFAGILLFMLVVGGYFFIYTRYNTLDNYFGGLWAQSSERALWQKSLGAFLLNLIKVPTDALLNLLPASIFIVFWFKSDFIKTVRSHAYLSFVFYLLVANLLVYWISPGTRQRYIYMLYPFMINLMVYFYLKHKDHNRKADQLAEILMGVFVGLGLAAGIALFFIPNFKSLNYIFVVAALTSFAGLLLLWAFFRYKSYRVYVLVATLIVLRFAFNFTIMPYRAIDSDGARYKHDAAKVVQLARNTDLHIYQKSRFSLEMVFYIERSRLEVLARKQEMEADALYLSHEKYLDPKNYETLYEFDYQGNPFKLVRFRHPE